MGRSTRSRVTGYVGTGQLKNPNQGPSIARGLSPPLKPVVVGARLSVGFDMEVMPLSPS